jgi:hypothetical protein
MCIFALNTDIMSEKEKHIGNSGLLDRPKKPLSFKLKEHCVKNQHIAPGAVTIDKLGERILPSDVALINFILPWFEIETGEDGKKYLVGYYADDGAIKDMGMDEETGEIWVIVTDGDSSKQHEDGWDDVDYLQDRRIMVSANLTNEICPVELPEGGECTVVYENTTKNTDFTVSINSNYKTPDGDTVEATVPAGGYAEVSWLRTGGVVYVRGI